MSLSKNQELELQVEEALADLGETEEEVYQKLKNLKIKGTPRKGGFCPLANYLSQITGVGMCVGCQTVADYNYTINPVPLSCAAYVFRVKFDSLEYMDLIEGNT
jgi:hypothetical protein